HLVEVLLPMRRGDLAGHVVDGFFVELAHGHGEPPNGILGITSRHPMRNPEVNYPIDFGFFSEGGPPIARRSQERAYDQSLSAVEGEMPSTRAACALVNPAKKRSFTRSAFRLSLAVSCSSASSRASRSWCGSSRAGSTPASSTRRCPLPAFAVFLW